MKRFILVFDIPREEPNVKLRVNRELHKVGAKMLQHSMWKFRNLNTLINVAMIVKKAGGKARILEERFIF